MKSVMSYIVVFSLGLSIGYFLSSHGIRDRHLNETALEALMSANTVRVCNAGLEELCDYMKKYGTYPPYPVTITAEQIEALEGAGDS